MNWIKKLLSIKDKLSENGYDEHIKRITDAQMVLGTPGEMFLEVMNELILMRRDFPDVYKTIEPEVNELIKYGRSINYFDPDRHEPNDRR